ncbi:tat (twin-arginine translocation) pathway signal sequence [bacterium]|nr:MAG: tat (twin-arginine translocation) pathway signal sequence [bacterium]
MPRTSLPSTMTRGSMLQGTGVLMGTLAASSVLANLAPSRAWALPLHALSQAEGETILQFGRVLYPHKTLPTAVYALLVKDLDAEAARDASVATLLREGSASLDAASGGKFTSASSAKRLAAVKHIEGTPYFSKVRSTCITSLYNNEMAFAHFGYEGPSWPKGGYLHRGFDDLTWLPKPPASASPPAG